MPFVPLLSLSTITLLPRCYYYASTREGEEVCDDAASATVEEAGEPVYYCDRHLHRYLYDETRLPVKVPR